ncbi:MAG: hypothetical protein HGB12_00040 [Bacteroidetes bacterium]|nr:hypothetical protein [Bacteroidota bacterium]
MKTKSPFALCLRHRRMPYAFFIALCLFLTFNCFAQGVSINTTGNEADNSAALDISSTTQGALIPRMTMAQRNQLIGSDGISGHAPATGCLIYQTDNTPGYYYYNGSAWMQAIGPTGASGTNGTNGAAGNTGATGPTGAAGSNGSNGTTGNTGVTGITGTTGTTGSDGQTSGQLYWFHHADSDISGYEGFKRIPNAGSEVIEAIPCTNSNTEYLVDAYATLPAVPGLSSFPIGLWQFHTYGFVNANTGNLVFRVFKRISDSPYTETEIFNVTSPNITNTSVAEIITNYTQTSPVAMNSSDRIIVKIYVKNTNGNKTVSFVYEGSTHVSYVITSFGLTAVVGATGATGATGPLVTGNSGQTLRNDGSGWAANSLLYNNGTNVGIGTVSPASSALLDLSSTTQGILIPRVAIANRPTTPATGLIIYNTDCNELQYYNGTTWISVMNSLSLFPPVAAVGSGATETQITANWNVSTGATHYHLDVSTSGSFANFVTGFSNKDVSTVITCNITGLTCGTTYYYRVRAENTCSTSGNSGAITYATSVCFNCGSTITDSRDSKQYASVLIGTQCWMAQNMNVGIKVAGSATQTSGTDNNNTSIEKYCYGDNEANCTSYGGIYQWSEAMAYKNGCSNTTSQQPAPPVQGICPTGWHIPSAAEWATLYTYLGGTYSAKSMASTSGWNSSGTSGNVGCNQASNNSSGFNALPGGYLNSGGSFTDVGVCFECWTATENNATSAGDFGLHYAYSNVFPNTLPKALGGSVRCLKDN